MDAEHAGMGKTKRYSGDTLRDYAQLLTRSEVTKLVEGEDFSTINHFIRRYDAKAFLSGKTYGKYFTHVYSALRGHYVNEYVVKNEFITYGLQQLSLCDDDSKVHVYSEFKIGDAIADLALFNGHSVGIEIKSYLDSPSRLGYQLPRYLDFFNSTYIIVPAGGINAYKPFATDARVGLIAFDARGKRFTVEKKAQRNATLSPRCVMEVLRTAEYKRIVREYFAVDSLDGENDFNRFELYGSKLATIPREELNRLVVGVLKERGIPISVFTRRHPEFNQALLALKSSSDFRSKLYSILDRPILTDGERIN